MFCRVVLEICDSSFLEFSKIRGPYYNAILSKNLRSPFSLAPFLKARSLLQSVMSQKTSKTLKQIAVEIISPKGQKNSTLTKNHRFVERHLVKKLNLSTLIWQFCNNSFFCLFSHLSYLSASSGNVAFSSSTQQNCSKSTEWTCNTKVTSRSSNPPTLYLAHGRPIAYH